ncbi:helix-turn-helix transcriptional regulator [Streptomyces sp. NPDC001514]
MEHSRHLSLAGTASVADARWVGRANELASLRDLLADLRSGRGGCALVEGPPGIGKTELINEAFRSVDPDRVTVLRGGADEFCTNLPFQLINDALRQIRTTDVGRQEVAPQSLWAATTRNPLVAGMEATVAEIERLCARGPVVLIANDLQWADEASLTVLGALVRLTAQLPLLIVGDLSTLRRRDDVGQFRRALLSRQATVLTLGPLSSKEAVLLAGEFLGAPASGTLSEEIQRTGGNPLYIRELTAALVRDSHVRVHEGKAELLPAPENRNPLPTSLSAAIADRLGVLSPDTLEVLHSASLLGGGFGLSELCAVVGWPTDRVIDAIGEAVSTGIVADDANRLRFPAPLLRSALYESMPVSLRSLRHRRAARVFAETGLAPERVAAQLVQANDERDEWTIDWLGEAAPALLYSAPGLAGELLRRATGHLAWDDDRREPLEAALAMAAYLRGQFAEAETTATRVLGRTDSTERAGEMAWLLGYMLWVIDRFQEAAEVVTAVSRQRELGALWEARLRCLHGVILCTSGMRDVGRKDLTEALEQGRRLGDARTVGYSSNMLATLSRAEHDVARLMDHVDEGLTAVAEIPELSDCRILLLTTKMAGQLLLDVADDSVEETVVLARRVADEAGTVISRRVSDSAAAISYHKGRWDDALAELEDVVGLPGCDFWVVGAHGTRALIAVQRGQLSTAHEHLDAIGDVDQLLPKTRKNAVLGIRAAAMLAEREGRSEDALALLERTTADAYFFQVPNRHEWMPFLVRTALAEGRKDLAEAAAEAVEKDALVARHPEYRAAARHCRALLTGDPAPLREALEYYRGARRVPKTAECAEDLAAVLAAAGQLGAARAAMQESVTGYLALGATGDLGELGRASSRWRQLGLRRSDHVARRPATGWGSLTPTEVRVAELVAEGLSNPDIAERLCSSRRTVGTHVSRILGKLGMHSRAEVVRDFARATAALEPAQ